MIYGKACFRGKMAGFSVRLPRTMKRYKTTHAALRTSEKGDLKRPWPVWLIEQATIAV
jgi:hypothetical protein